MLAARPPDRGGARRENMKEPGSLWEQPIILSHEKVHAHTDRSSLICFSILSHVGAGEGWGLDTVGRGTFGMSCTEGLWDFYPSSAVWGVSEVWTQHNLSCPIEG